MPLAYWKQVSDLKTVIHRELPPADVFRSMRQWNVPVASLRCEGSTGRGPHNRAASPPDMS